MNVDQQGGNERGILQLDENTWGTAIPDWDDDPRFASVAAVGQLADGMRLGIKWFQNHGDGPWVQLAGELRTYNHGGEGKNRVGAVDQTGISNFADRGTARNIYVSNVLAIARDYFGFVK